MTRSCTVEMPNDWNDHAGWDEFYAWRAARRKRDEFNETGSISADRVPELAKELTSGGGRDVWLPGCGLSPLGRLLAHVGLRVVATDVSSVAVQFQRTRASRFSHLLAPLGQADPAGSFTAEQHDFREKFHSEAFDLVLNVKAIQGFGPSDLERIARVHANSLKPGGTALFDTMNVQGTRRDLLEQTLEAGGFVVPFRSVNQWYREQLRDTGIPHAFVLGRPIIPSNAEGLSDQAARDAAKARLRAITEEYHRRLEACEESERQRGSGEAKIASVIYSTG